MHKYFLVLSFGLLSVLPMSIDAKDNAKIKVENKVSCKSFVNKAELVANPSQWLNKEVCFEGEFSSFGNLALDYPKAERSHKDFVSFIVFRSDTDTPLSELKLAYPVKKAKAHPKITKVKKGTSLKVKGKVFSTALNEPWIDIIDLQIMNNKDSDE